MTLNPKDEFPGIILPVFTENIISYTRYYDNQ